MNRSISWKKISVHLLIWISYLILLSIFHAEVRSFENAFARSIVTVLVQAFVFYLNLYVLLPKLLDNKKTFLYALLLLVLVVVMVKVYDELLHNIVYDELKEYFERRDEFKPDREKGFRRDLGRGPHSSRFATGRYLTNGFFIFIALLISTIYHNTLANKRREQEHIRIKNQMLEAESKMLKWQINPHFLFNTLNNIYSMSQLKSDKTPDAIHKLSQMLRYVIYECNDDFVKLDKEIEYIKSYVDLQLLKDENMDNVSVEIKNSNPKLNIAPMLLISFIENGFKHSNIEDTENSWIKIRIETKGNQLDFNMENSIPKEHSKDKIGGIGIENVKRRLNLLYLEKHYLNLKQENNVYKVELMIELDEN